MRYCIEKELGKFNIRHVLERDKSFWFALDKHLSESEFELKVRDKRGYIVSGGDKPVGVMRYNLFWDIIPFLTFIYKDRGGIFFDNTPFEQPQEMLMLKVF